MYNCKHDSVIVFQQYGSPIVPCEYYVVVTCCLSYELWFHFLYVCQWYYLFEPFPIIRSPISPNTSPDCKVLIAVSSLLKEKLREDISNCYHVNKPEHRLVAPSNQCSWNNIQTPPISKPSGGRGRSRGDWRKGYFHFIRGGRNECTYFFVMNITL